jgi:plastocyanin
VFDGNPPAPALLNVPPNQVACLANGPLFSQEWVVNADNKGVKNAFVWLTAPGGGKLSINPALAAINNPIVIINQPCCAFDPHAVALREGQILQLNNNAPIAHNVSWQGGRLKNPGGNVIVPAGRMHQLANLKADTGPVSLSCNIHPWMKGWVRVFDHPYYAVTDADGRFEIKLVPPGNAQLVGWHEGAGWLGGAGKNGKAITLYGGNNDLGRIEIKR